MRKSQAKAGSVSGWRLFRSTVLSASIMLAPVAAVLLLPLAAGWGEILDAALPVREPAENAPDILNSISSDLGSLAVATLAALGTIVIAGDRAWLTRPRVALSLAAVVAAICSIYAGVRFRFALVEQIMMSPLDLDRIGDRLGTQGATLLAAVCCLVLLAFQRLDRET